MASQIARALPAGVAFFKEDQPSDRERTSRFLNKRKLLALPPEKRQKAIDANRRGQIQRASKGLKAALRKYDASANEFFSQPENRLCLICLRLVGDGEKIEIQKATERHHVRGRIGRLLNWRPGWIPSCFIHRSWPHANPKRARKLGLLSAPQDWNVFPE